MSAQHTQSASEMEWKEMHEEVDLNDPYPYDDDDRANGSHHASSNSSAVPLKKKRPRVTIVSRQHSPVVSHSSAETDYPGTSVDANEDFADFNAGSSTPNPTLEAMDMDTSTLSTLSHSSPPSSSHNNQQGSGSATAATAAAAPSYSPTLDIGPSPTPPGAPFLRARSLSEESTQPFLSQYSAASPQPPPPPDTPSSYGDRQYSFGE